MKLLSSAFDALAYKTQVQRQLGDISEAPEFVAASSLSRIPADPANVRKALRTHGDAGDILALALHVHELPLTDANRDLIRKLMDVGNLKKSQDASKAPFKPAVVDPITSGATVLLSSLLEGIAQDMVVDLELNSRHSAGAKLVFLGPEFGVWLIKPGSGEFSPAAGVSDLQMSQTMREAAFWYAVEQGWPGQQFYPRCEVFNIDGVETALVQVLPPDYIQSNRDPLFVRRLEKYRADGTIYKWALWDYLLGNPDNHSGNILVSPKAEIAMIDHGSAFAGRNFAPALDPNSFIPYYLRAWHQNLEWHKISSQERVEAMPQPSPQQSRDFETLVATMPIRASFSVLYKVAPQTLPSVIARYEKLLMESNKLVWLLKWWAGVVQ